jgi:hypothetical protein
VTPTARYVHADADSAATMLIAATMATVSTATRVDASDERGHRQPEIDRTSSLLQNQSIHQSTKT